MDSPSTPTTPVATRAALRARVATATAPVTRSLTHWGPRCARRGCYYPAWFAIHHVPVCSSRCAERIAAEPPVVPRELPTFAPVVRAVRWTYAGAPWTLVIASCGHRDQHLRAWWWRGRGTRVGSLIRTRPRNVDILTTAGLFAFVRRLVAAGATELRPYRLTHSTPPWADVALTGGPEACARRTARRAKAAVRRAEQVAALRARYRQRGVIQDGTRAHAARVA